jgi:hypothetical protein
MKAGKRGMLEEHKNNGHCVIGNTGQKPRRDFPNQ